MGRPYSEPLSGGRCVIFAPLGYNRSGRFRTFRNRQSPECLRHKAFRTQASREGFAPLPTLQRQKLRTFTHAPPSPALLAQGLLNPCRARDSSSTPQHSRLNRRRFRDAMTPEASYRTSANRDGGHAQSTLRGGRDNLSSISVVASNYQHKRACTPFVVRAHS